MSRQHIIDEIVRTAEKNAGQPLGKKRFQDETGIKESDWLGKYWARWSDAVKEAGYRPNALQGAYKEGWLIEQLISPIRELGRFPVSNDLRLKAHTDDSFPSHTTFGKLGNKAETVKRVLNYCREQSGYDDVICICESIGLSETKVRKAKNAKDQ